MPHFRGRPVYEEVDPMGRKVAVSLLALALGLSMVALTLLAEGETDGTAWWPSKPSPADKPAEKSDFMRKEAEGRVVSVSPGDRTLVVLETEKRLWMRFIVGDSAAEDLSTIKRGDEVTVQYTDEGGRIIAQEINKKL